MIMMMAANGADFLFFRFGGELVERSREGVLALHGGKDLRAVKLIPGSGDDDGGRVVLPEHFDRCGELVRRDGIRAGKDDRAGVLHLVVKELAEVLHVHPALVGIHHSGEAVERKVMGIHALHGADHVAQLAYAGGLDEDTVRRELGEHLLERIREVAHEAAADAAGVHLGDLHAGILQKAAIHGDLAEFVFN